MVLYGSDDSDICLFVSMPSMSGTGFCPGSMVKLPSSIIFSDAVTLMEETSFPSGRSIFTVLKGSVGSPGIPWLCSPDTTTVSYPLFFPMAGFKKSKLNSIISQFFSRLSIPSAVVKFSGCWVSMVSALTTLLNTGAHNKKTTVNVSHVFINFLFSIFFHSK